MRKTLIWMLVLIYLVILAGALVRMTGSGMGCPDWPKCFGQYIPPTDISQLPEDYKTRFAVMGKEVADFSAFHTWVEYINRLLGVVLGISILINLFQAIRKIKTDRLLFFLAFLQLVFVGFQGWLGAVVVATDLAPAKITVHMLMAILLIANALFMYHRLHKFDTIETKSQSPYLLIVALFLLILQIVFGTQVRESIDEIAKEMNQQGRETWIEQLPLIFKIHRSTSILVLISLFFSARFLLFKPDLVSKHATVAFSLVITIILTGMAMAYLGMPALMQPIHLVISLALAGVLISWLIIVSTRKWKVNA